MPRTPVQMAVPVDFWVEWPDQEGWWVCCSNSASNTATPEDLSRFLYVQQHEIAAGKIELPGGVVLSDKIPIRFVQVDLHHRLLRRDML